MRFTSFFLLFLAAFGLAPAQGQQVQSITIHSAWSGLGQTGEADLNIRRVRNRYSDGNRAISEEQVQAFVQSLKQPPLAKADAANLGINAEWLNAHVEKAWERSFIFMGRPLESVEAKRVFSAAFVDENTLPERLEDVYRGFHTDDYPHMELNVKFTDGTSISIKSNSQNPYMLPWAVTNRATTDTTFNADISRTLLVLLPDPFLNRERLTDEEKYATGLFAELAQRTAWKLRAPR